MPKPVKAYPVRLVGTRSYAGAMGRAAIGDVVELLHEDGNPYDAGAIVVVDGDGATLGYVPRDNWLRGPLTDEGKGARAVVDGLDGGMTIAVALIDEGVIGRRDFVPAD